MNERFSAKRVASPQQTGTVNLRKYSNYLAITRFNIVPRLHDSFSASIIASGLIITTAIFSVP